MDSAKMRTAIVLVSQHPALGRKLKELKMNYIRVDPHKKSKQILVQREVSPSLSSSVETFSTDKWSTLGMLQEDADTVLGHVRSA